MNKENNFRKNTYKRLQFFGQGSTYFGIVALNVVLTVITLGIYYPWAKAAFRRYIWNETEMKDSRFVFHGTGAEMFKGWIIVWAFCIMFYASIVLVSKLEWLSILLFFFYISLFILTPFAIFGAWRYRLTRTSWRGVFFQFDGNFKFFLKLFLKHGFYTLITLGIYAPWMRVKLQSYLFSHSYLGNIRFGFKGEGDKLFGINFLGAILTYITLGLYFPIYMKQRFNFSIDNTYLNDGVTKKTLKSTLENEEAWKTIMVNILLLIFTLGLAFPWIFVREMKMYFRNTLIPNEFDFDNLAQLSEDKTSSVGDQLIDALDFDIGF